MRPIQEFCQHVTAMDRVLHVYERVSRVMIYSQGGEIELFVLVLEMPLTVRVLIQYILNINNLSFCKYNHTGNSLDIHTCT